MPGIQPWVGLGVIADNLINLCHALAFSQEPSSRHDLPDMATVVPPTVPNPSYSRTGARSPKFIFAPETS
jgi:hypothetical protein